jgi:hypothetical protein
VHHCDRNTIAMIMTLSAGDPARKFAIARVVLAAALACWSGGASGQTREPTPAEQAYVEHERAVSQYNAAANDPFAGEVTIVRVAIAGDYPAEIVAAPETWEVPVGAMPPAGPIEARAEGGPTKKGKPYLVGEEGAETFVPDEPGTIVPYAPRATGKENFGKWPRVPSPDHPGQYICLGGAIQNATRAAQNPLPSLMDLIDSGVLMVLIDKGVLPEPSLRWLYDPRLIAMGRARIEDRRNEPPPPPPPPPWKWNQAAFDKLMEKQNEHFEKRLQEDKKPRVFD